MAAEMDAGAQALYPSLYEFLTATSYDDKSERQLPTLLLFGEDGMWKCCLNDRDQSRMLWVSGASLSALFASLDAAIGGGCAEWRAAKPWKKR
jgi:hypothetical protein